MRCLKLNNEIECLAADYYCKKLLSVLSAVRPNDDTSEIAKINIVLTEHLKMPEEAI